MAQQQQRERPVATLTELGTTSREDEALARAPIVLYMRMRVSLRVHVRYRYTAGLEACRPRHAKAKTGSRQQNCEGHGPIGRDSRKCQHLYEHTYLYLYTLPPPKKNTQANKKKHMQALITRTTCQHQG